MSYKKSPLLKWYDSVPDMIPWPNMFFQQGWFLDSVASRSIIRSLRLANFTVQVCLSLHLSLSPGFCEFRNWTFFIMYSPCCMICAAGYTLTVATLVILRNRIISLSYRNVSFQLRIYLPQSLFVRFYFKKKKWVNEASRVECNDVIKLQNRR